MTSGEHAASVADGRRLSRLSTVSDDRMHLCLMMAMTFGTGIVDAVGYLGLDRVFTGNMTGNVVILGMALVGADGLPVLGPLLALLGFLGGAAFGGRVLRRAAGGWTPRITLLLSVVSAMMLSMAVLLFAGGDNPSKAVEVLVTTVLGAAMGTQAATARFIGVKDVTTVVVTSTITGLAADSVLGGGGGQGSGRRLTAVVLMLVGAGVGAALLHWHLGAGLALVGGIVLLTTSIGAVHARARVTRSAG